MVLQLAFTASVDKTMLVSGVSPLYQDMGRKLVHAVATCHCGGGQSPLYLIGTAGCGCYGQLTHNSSKCDTTISLQNVVVAKKWQHTVIDL